MCAGATTKVRTITISHWRKLSDHSQRKPAAIQFEASNPRHAHEWVVWKKARIPENKILIPGVLTSTSNYVEHPEFVAQRICQFADIVGRERVIAGTDCGFGTFAGIGKMDAEISFKKLKALVEGAELASRRLWKQARQA